MKIVTQFKPYAVIILMLVISVGGYAQNADFNPSKWLVPQPQQIEVGEGKQELREGRILLKADIYHSSHLYQNIVDLQSTIVPWAGNREVTRALGKGEIPAIQLEIDSQFGKAQGYQLAIAKGQIKVKATDEAGLFYAIATLKQIAAYASATDHLPQVSISDFPDFEKRGIMLDISREKVPTMKSLYELIDKMAAWKMNELQLYTEHTFAYKKHKTVWQYASPITAEEILLLDQYCKDRFIDLVPNQNSFGHMKKWLDHKEYTHLAECEEGCKTPSGLRARQALSPTEPGALKLMDELYAELLPNFSSEYFNIGCDETFELGYGKSKALIEEKGKGQVYLEFLTELNKYSNKYGKKAMFWSDIILHYPELIPDLPKDITCLIWGYGAKASF